MKYRIYILECADGTLYTGISNDVEKRIALHNLGRGAKYTKGRTPVVLRYLEEVEGRGPATKREIEVKSLNKIKKLKLIAEFKAIYGQ